MINYIEIKYPTIHVMNGINKIVDLFKLSNDRILVDPSENITNTKPKIKT